MNSHTKDTNYLSSSNAFLGYTLHNKSKEISAVNVLNDAFVYITLFNDHH